jgi:death-on-curing protein
MVSTFTRRSRERLPRCGHSLISNHPFIDGNKRVGHAAIEVMLVLNGHEIESTVDEQEKAIIEVASGALSRDDFASWLEQRVVKCAGRKV